MTSLEQSKYKVLGCKGRPFSECVDKIVGKKDGKQAVRGEKIFVRLCECVPDNL